jgi:hypothetical protein
MSIAMWKSVCVTTLLLKPVAQELPVTENGINWKALILSLPTPENTEAGAEIERKRHG